MMGASPHARCRRQPSPLLVGALLACLNVAGGPVSGAPESPPKPATPAAAAPTAPAQATSTRKMAERLRQLLVDADPRHNPTLNVRRAEQLRVDLAGATDPDQRLKLRIELGNELVLAGKTDDGIAQLKEAREQAGAPIPGSPPPTVQDKIDAMLGIAYLRLGEQENCIAAHTSASCVLPIRKEGFHTIQRGSRLAIDQYTALLAHEPQSLSYRYLLNLAYMTLGEYPDKVPERWLIPPSVFASEADAPAFVDVAPLLGLDVTGGAGGVIVDDFNGDGYLDTMVSSWGLGDQLRYFQNNADGTFSERTAEAGLTGITGGLNLLQADYNNDGYPDVLVLRGAWLGFTEAGEQPRSLLRNNGDGTFTDVTEEAGLLSLHPSQTAAWGDFDNDGHLDLFIGNESVGGHRHPCQLYHNNGDGTFTDVASEVSLDDVGFVKGVAWGDYNNDGRIDLFLSRFGQSSVLYRNDGPLPLDAPPASGAAPAGGKPKLRWKFTDVTAEAGLGKRMRSFSTWFFDYDNDGWLDIMESPFLGFVGNNLETVVADYLGMPVANPETPRLYHNQHDGTFAEVSKEVHLDHPMLTMAANFGDIDNDGYLDVYWGTGEPNLSTLIANRMFRNDGGRRFQDVTTATRLGHLQKGHAIAFADFDNDGTQDIYAVFGGAYEGDVYQRALFLNPGNGNHWVTLKLEGVESNRSAIGARIKVTVAEGAGTRDIYATAGSGGSFGASPLRQHIGLGAATAIQQVEITWPRGRRQRFDHLDLDRFYHLREGDPVPRPMTLKRLDLLAHPRPAHGALGLPAAASRPDVGKP